MPLSGCVAGLYYTPPHPVVLTAALSVVARLRPLKMVKENSCPRHDMARAFLALEGGVTGRLVFELCPDACPTAVTNFAFVAMRHKLTDLAAARQQELGAEMPPPLAGSTVPRVLANEMLELGEAAPRSFFGGFFADEAAPAGWSHDRPGVLGMVSMGPGTNASRFYVTFGPLPELDGQQTILGRLVEGLEVLQAVAQVKTDPRRGHAPHSAIVVADCGVSPLHRIPMLRGAAPEPTKAARGKRIRDDEDGEVTCTAVEIPRPEAGAMKRRRGEAMVGNELQAMAIPAGPDAESKEERAAAATQYRQTHFESDVAAIAQAQAHKLERKGNKAARGAARSSVSALAGTRFEKKSAPKKKKY